MLAGELIYRNQKQGCYFTSFTLICFFLPNHAPRLAASNAITTIPPTIIPPLWRDAGGVGSGVGVRVAGGVMGRVGLEAGIPDVTVIVGSNVAVLRSGLLINNFCPIKILLEERPFIFFNSSIVKL